MNIQYPDVCQDNEWEYFIGEIISSETGTNLNIKIPSWINSTSQQSYKDLCTNFQDLTSKCGFHKYSSDWSRWIRSNASESTVKTSVFLK